MKILIPALIALSAWCAPAFSATPSQGSKVVIPPLVSKVASKTPSRPMTVRLPTQAGKVSKVIATNLLKSPSAIAIGDKYISLCAPNRKLMTCAPIVATGVMKGIEVGAMAGSKGEPLITFNMDPNMAPKRAAYAIRYFLARIDKVAARLNRVTVSYSPAPLQNALTVGATNSFVVVPGGGSGGGGSTCAFDDDGDVSCMGGDSEGGGNGGTDDPGQCQGDCGYPAGDNGDGDPCIAPDGSRICNAPSDIPQVPVNGQRPAEEPMSMPACMPVGRFGAVCSPMPPVVGGIPDLPKQTPPWLSQSTCNQLPWLCSTGQYPDNDRGDAETSGKTKYQLYAICETIETTERDVCRASRGGMDSRSLTVCFDKATARKIKCYETARELTGDGSYPAP